MPIIADGFAAGRAGGLGAEACVMAPRRGPDAGRRRDQRELGRPRQAGSACSRDGGARRPHAEALLERAAVEPVGHLEVLQRRQVAAEGAQN